MQFEPTIFFEGVEEFMRDAFGHEWNAAAEVVDGGTKGWKTLFIVLKFWKRVVLDVSPIRKKLRVG